MYGQERLPEYVLTKHEKRIKDMYYHWSYGLLCVWCLVGLLLGMGLFIQGLSDSHWHHEILVSGIIVLSTIISGGYIKIIGDEEHSVFEKEFEITRENTRRGF